MIDVKIENKPALKNPKYSGKPYWKYTCIICPNCDFQIALNYKKIAELITKLGECEKENYKKALDRLR